MLLLCNTLYIICVKSLIKYLNNLEEPILVYFHVNPVSYNK